MSQNGNDFITDQEMAFARLVLAGTMTDKQAAKTVGLNPHSAAYIKCKPSVRAYMQEHRAQMQERLARQEAEQLSRSADGRERLLARLWQIADMSPDMTRGSTAGQIKALAMIAHIEGLIPGRRAAAPAMDNKPAAPPDQPKIYVAEWLRQKETNTPHQEEERPDPPAEAPPSAKPAVPTEPAQSNTANPPQPQPQSAKYESFVPDAWRR